jgi:hypothetical protein
LVFGGARHRPATLNGVPSAEPQSQRSRIFAPGEWQ